MRNLFVFCIFTFIMVLSGCKEDTITDTKDTGMLKIYLTDAPAAYDSINITFTEVSAHLDSNWVTVVNDPVTYDLLGLTNGKFEVLGAADVPAGHYSQIRIMIDNAEIGVDGEVFPLDVPSGAQTGLKLGIEFTIETGSAYEVMVDFDASRSIVTTGPPNDPTGYKLKPHLRATAMAVAGSISGKVTNPERRPVAYAIQGSDTVTSAQVSLTDSTFMLSYLPEGRYTVSIRDTSDRSYHQDLVPAAVGVDNYIGLITLQ